MSENQKEKGQVTEFGISKKYLQMTGSGGGYHHYYYCCFYCYCTPVIVHMDLNFVGETRDTRNKINK